MSAICQALLGSMSGPSQIVVVVVVACLRVYRLHILSYLSSPSYPTHPSYMGRGAFVRDCLWHNLCSLPGKQSWGGGTLRAHWLLYQGCP